MDNGYDLENGRRSLTWRGIPSIRTDSALTTSVTLPVPKLVVHFLRGVLTQTTSPSYLHQDICGSGWGTLQCLLLGRGTFALAGARKVGMSSLGVTLYQ